MIKRILEKKLTYRERKSLPNSAFVFPKDRKYPIHDIAHGRNALARVSAHGTPAEIAKVRQAVYSKYPELAKRKAEKLPLAASAPNKESRMTERYELRKWIWEHIDIGEERGEGQGVGGPIQGDGGASVCVCPACGTEVEHDRGTPCSEVPCPKCGTSMVGKSVSEMSVQQAVSASRLARKLATKRKILTGLSKRGYELGKRGIARAAV